MGIRESKKLVSDYCKSYRENWILVCISFSISCNVKSTRKQDSIFLNLLMRMLYNSHARA